MASKARSRLGVRAAFSGRLCRFKLVPAKWRYLVPPALIRELREGANATGTPQRACGAGRQPLRRLNYIDVTDQRRIFLFLTRQLIELEICDGIFAIPDDHLVCDMVP